MRTAYRRLLHRRAYFINCFVGLAATIAFAVLLWPATDQLVKGHLGLLPSGPGDWMHTIPGFLVLAAGAVLILSAYFALCRIVEESAPPPAR